MISIAPTQTKNLMPPEWAPHTRTWMAFPTANDTFGAPASETLHRARTTWAKVASVISNYEPVTLVVDPADKGAVGQYVPTASQISLLLAESYLHERLHRPHKLSTYREENRNDHPDTRTKCK